MKSGDNTLIDTLILFSVNTFHGIDYYMRIDSPLGIKKDILLTDEEAKQLMKYDKVFPDIKTL